MIAWTTGTLATGEEDVYYEVTGEGVPLVLCHGAGGNHAVWYQQVPVLAERFRVVTWDQRGFGMSTNRCGRDGPAAAVQDLTALLDHLGVERAHLVGQSMGGWAVMGFALEHTDRVLSLTISDSTAGVMTERMAEGLAAPGRTIEMPRGEIGAHPAIGHGLRRRDPVKAFLYQQIGGFRTLRDDAAVVAKLVATTYPLDRIRALAVPVLLIVGSEDGLIPPEVVREMSTVVPKATVVEIAGAGHSPYFEEPEAWNRALLGFLETRM